MVCAAGNLDIFAFVGEAHPFAPAVGAFREALRTDAAIMDSLAAGHGAAMQAEIHAEIKALPTGETYLLDRFYWSLQQRGPGTDYRARTAYYRRDVTPLNVFDFPFDPYLGALAPCMQQARESADDLRVLRYVPLRRLTFLANGKIAKVKRARLLDESYERLAAVRAAASGTGFRIAAPLGIDRRLSVFFQERLRGENVANQLACDRIEAQMAQVGQVHAGLHAMRVQGMPDWSMAKYLKTLQADCAWIAFFFPALGARLAAVRAQLERSVPDVDDGEQVFCQGDFVVSQLLDDGESLAVTDFDMARRGDRHQEIAKLLASLKYDVPLLQDAVNDGDEGLVERAESAYFEAYCRRAVGKVDAARVDWYRTCQEIHYLALSLKKDTWQPRRFERGLSLVDRLLAASSRAVLYAG